MNQKISDSLCFTCESASAIISTYGSKPYTTCYAGSVSGVQVMVDSVLDCPYYDRRESEAEKFDRENMESDWW